MGRGEKQGVSIRTYSMDQLSQRGLYKAPLQSRSDAPLKLEHLFSEQKSFLPSESFRVVIDLEKQFHDLRSTRPLNGMPLFTINRCRKLLISEHATKSPGLYCA